MKSNNKLSIKYIVLLFVPLFAAIFIQYLVSITDIIILFIKNMIQDKALSADESASSVIEADYKSSVNTGAIFFAQYFLYTIVFGIWYYISIVNKHNLKSTKDEDIYGLRAVSYRVYSGIKKLTKKTVAIIIVAGILCQTYTDAILSLIKNAAPGLFEDYDKMIEKIIGSYSSPLLLFTVFILAPIAEELLFRGVILSYARKNFKTSIAIIINGLLFGLYHGNVIQGCYAFIFGMIIAIIVIHFDSIVPGILFHIAVNTSVIVVQDSWFTKTSSCIAALLVSLSAFAALFYILIKKKDNKDGEQ